MNKLKLYWELYYPILLAFLSFLYSVTLWFTGNKLEGIFVGISSGASLAAVKQKEAEFAPGSRAKCWGYNGSTPGPTIEAVEGDRVRILVTNCLKEHTTIHWHGLLLPSGMDGVGGLNQPQIQPGETFAYEFTLIQHGSHMYHPR